MTNSKLYDDGMILYSMRNNGMNDDDARLLLEEFQTEPYTVKEWDEITFHADIKAIHESEKYSEYDFNYEDAA